MAEVKTDSKNEKTPPEKTAGILPGLKPKTSQDKGQPDRPAQASPDLPLLRHHLVRLGASDCKSEHIEIIAGRGDDFPGSEPA